MTPRVTLAAVAAHAGVSKQTVSNALNSPELLRPDTLERVQAAVAQLGYRPSRAARQLRTGTPRTIGVALSPAVAGGAGQVGDRFLHALALAARRRGYRILLLAAADDAEEIAHYAEVLEGGELDSFVLTGTHHGDPRTAWLAAHGASFVTFGRPWGQDDGAAHAWVDVDGAAGTAAAVEHLAARGHTRIAFAGWPAGSGVGDDRRRGWLEAVTRLGLPPAADPASWSVPVENAITEGGRAAEHLLAACAPTAVVAVSDTVALGVLRHLRQRGHPGAVTGFDDTDVAAAVGLTSLAQPLGEAAEEAVALLLDIEAASTPPAVHLLLPPALVVRESSPPPEVVQPVPTA